MKTATGLGLPLETPVTCVGPWNGPQALEKGGIPGAWPIECPCHISQHVNGSVIHNKSLHNALDIPSATFDEILEPFWQLFCVSENHPWPCYLYFGFHVIVWVRLPFQFQ